MLLRFKFGYCTLYMCMLLFVLLTPWALWWICALYKLFIIVIYYFLQNGTLSPAEDSRLPVSPDSIAILVHGCPDAPPDSNKLDVHPTIRRFCSANDAMLGPNDDLMVELERTRSKDDYVRRRPVSMNYSVSSFAFKALNTFGSCQRQVFSLGISQYMHKVTNLWKFKLLVFEVTSE